MKTEHLATYEYFLEEIMQRIQISSFKNGDTPHTDKTMVYAKLSLTRVSGDSPALHGHRRAYKPITWSRSPIISVHVMKRWAVNGVFFLNRKCLVAKVKYTSSYISVVGNMRADITMMAFVGYSCRALVTASRKNLSFAVCFVIFD